MSTMHAGRVPQFGRHDRLRLARETAGIGTSELAAEIGVSRNTITNYERGHVEPRRGALILWALRTGVPLKWLETGESPPPDGDGDSLVHPPGLEPGTHWLRVLPDQVRWAA